MATLKELQKEVKEFCTERDWDQYHTPVQLAIGTITEAAELLECFRFKTLEEQEEIVKSLAVAEEMADTLYFLLRMAQKYEVNLEEAFKKKMEKNAKRYPVETVKGKNKKYDEY
jgi:NTP pyrophosphatase (non-canonical NTP hydrolase)